MRRGLLEPAKLRSDVIELSAFVAARDSADGFVDVTSALSPGVMGLLTTPGLVFLTPVESGAAGVESGSNVQFVAMPTEWKQNTSTFTPVVAAGGVLQVAIEMVVDPPFVPGDREGHRGVFSGTEGAVYLVGGRRPGGKPTGQVWRYALRDQTWRPLFVNRGTPSEPGRQARPADVLAVAYAPRFGKLVVLDELEADGPAKAVFARLLVFDVFTDRSRVAAIVPRTKAMAHLGMAATDDGAFALVGQHSKGDAWTAFRFVLGPDDSILWTGIQSGPGHVLDDPFNTTPGVLLPVEKKGLHDLILLDAKPAGQTPSMPVSL